MVRTQRESWLHTVAYGSGELALLNAQGNLDEIVIRQPDVLEDAEWRQEQLKRVAERP
jgi:hypothetical protein